MLGNNWFALIITLILALAWLRLNDYFAHKGWISGEISRKIIHIGTGPIFVLCWLLFDSDYTARYLAALVPLGITGQFFLIGMGVLKDQASVDAMSRTGDRKEILRGPLFYGIVFVLLTIIYWKDNPIGIVALMLLCGGDGLADIVGKRIPSKKLFWSPRKSWIGSLGMFVGGWILSAGILTIYSITGVFSGTLLPYLGAVTLISFFGTIIESLPFRDIDNITVPAIAVLLGHFLL